MKNRLVQFAKEIEEPTRHKRACIRCWMILFCIGYAPINVLHPPPIGWGVGNHISLALDSQKIITYIIHVNIETKPLYCPGNNIGIIHVFSCSNICPALRRRLNTQPCGRVQKSSSGLGNCNETNEILPDSSLKSHQKCRKVLKIILLCMTNLFILFFSKLSWLAKSNVKDISCTNIVGVNKCIDKMIIPGCNILPHNVM